MKPILTAALLLGTSIAAFAQAKPLKVGWSIYTGWQPIPLTAMPLEKGKPSFLDRRAQAAGVKVEVVQFKEYIPSVTALAAGELDACAMTLQEALSIPVDSGIPVTVVLVNDYSNGNDALIAPTGSTLDDVTEVLCEEFSVSQYLTHRAFELAGKDPTKVSFKHTPGDEIPKVFFSAAARGKPPVVATWNPHTIRIAESGKGTVLFTSKQIPGEIVDCVVVRTDRIKGNEKAIQAFVDAYYDVIRYWQAPATKDRALLAMTLKAELTAEQVPLFQKMVDATAFYLTPADAAAFMESKEIRNSHDRIRAALIKFGAFKGKNPETYSVNIDTAWVRAAK